MKFHYTIISFILIFAAITRFYNLANPPAYYFDEVYHAVTAKAYAMNNPAGYEWWHDAPEPGTAYEWLHPPIAKLFMAFGWKYFGRTAWAWRVPGALIGVATIAVIYWLGIVVTNNRIIALLAASLASLDGLLLAMSRIGMNDIYVTCFMILAIGTYWKSRQIKHWPNWWLALASLFTGLAISTKWSGVFVIGMVGTWELLFLIQQKQIWFRRLPILILAFLIAPIAIYISSYGQFWLQGHTWAQFVELHNQIWWYQTNLKATHMYQSKAWEWPLDIRPVWMWVNYYEDGSVANIYNQANPLLFWFGLISIIWLILQLFHRPVERGWISIVLVAYAWSWMPWLFSPRIMFFYHYTPAVPWLAIALAYSIYSLWHTSKYRLLSTAIFASVFLTFIWLSPLWFGIPVEASRLPWLFLLPSWK